MRNIDLLFPMTNCIRILPMKIVQAAQIAKVGQVNYERHYIKHIQ